MSKLKPIVSVTMGDPNGIGPEICVETLMDERFYEESKPFIIGSVEIIKRAMKIVNCDFKINKISNPSEAKYEVGTIDILETGNYDTNTLEFGKIQKLAGQMSYDFIIKSIELGLAKEVDIISTAPIHKEAIKLAGVNEEGHTEIYGNLTGSDYALTMFHVHKLRVFFVSRHMSLVDACRYASKEKVLETTKQVYQELRKMGIDNPKIAIAALNPHGSDNGLFGNEENEQLIPAVKEAQELGLDAVGPIPADSIFHIGKSGCFDAILSLYHDQGHIACKTLDFEKCVTITFGLPFIRSSVDHGTAMDIAGKGIANSVSLKEATLVPIEYWRGQQSLLK